MNKKIKAAAVVLACMCIAPFTIAGCGSKENKQDVITDDDGNIIVGPGGTATNVTFWTDADDNELAVFKTIVDNFNTLYDGAIKVKLVNRAGDYETSLGQALAGSNPPDVFYVGDEYYKAYSEFGYLADITDWVNSSKIYNVDNMWDSAVTRYKYDVNTLQSGTESGHFYGVPKDIGPTVIFYNETYFEGAGIHVISVAADDLDAFNAGAADDRGKTKSDYGITDTVKEKGYFQMDGVWYFNNQIPMSWEETVACSLKVQEWMRSPTGANKPKGYGYFTEWWFNYGWSVGGNVIEEIPTDDPAYNGYYYDFTLMDNTSNYIVPDNVESVEVNGKTYYAGEIVEYTDKIDMSGYATKRNADGKDSYVVTEEVESLAAQGKLNKLPSQRAAFTEFVRLAASTSTNVDGINGYGITPLPNSLGDGGKNALFENGLLAMLVDGRWNVTEFRKNMGQSDADANNSNYYKWDVAPLPVYKEYDSNGDVSVHGVEAGHSGSVALCISSKSTVQTAAWKFIEYCASEEGMTLQANAGFAIPLQKDLAATEVFLQSELYPYNSKVFLKAAEVQQPGDWWMLTDKKWINDWANVLNDGVRNGTTTLEQFYNSTEYNATFTLLDKYCTSK